MNRRRPRPRDISPEVRELTDVPRLADGRIDLDGIVESLSQSDVLETADGCGWSYVVPHAGAELRDTKGVSAVHTVDGDVVTLGNDPFRAIDDVADELGISPHTTPEPTLPPFTGGLVGAFAYDLGRCVDALGSRTTARNERHMRLRTADTIVAVDPSRTTAHVLARPSSFAPLNPRQRVRSVDVALRRAVSGGAERVTTRRGGHPRTAAQAVITSLPGAAYRAAVRRVLAAIAAGDVFQVNLAQQLCGQWDADTFALYRALRAESRAAFGASLPGVGIASISPETFLRVAAGSVDTRPIKGTRRRDADPALDAALADDLATSQKDRAENIMVVDMERNDLGRVCRPGSITVPELTRVEAHPTVWHLVSTVRGQLRGDVGYGDLLRATFPCGSITGAPKIAAMRMIDELEPVRRGWYCGGIGFLGTGTASLSVAIRTAVLGSDGTVTYGAGSGIVADSDPYAEHLESLDKAAAFLRAIGGTVVDAP